jgi:hypothetical protein
MARRITVDFEDGTSHVYENAPDDLTPEVVTQRATQDFGKKVVKLDGGVEPKVGFLESTARDLASGFGTAASMAPRAVGYLAKAFLPEDNGLAAGANDVADSAERYWKEVGDKSNNNVWGQKAFRGVGGALTTGPASAVNMAAGAGAGLGDQAAEQLANGNPNPLLRVAGSVAGGLVAGTTAAVAARVRPQTADVAREAMEGLTPDQLNAAQQYKNQLAQKGIDIDLAQALQATSGHSGNLGSVRDFLAGRVQGDGVQRTLRGQPEALAREAELTVGSLPGTNFSATSNANFLQKTATTAIENAKKTRSDLWEQTVQDGVAALKASEGIKVSAAQDFLKETGISVGQARSQVNTLMNELATAKAGDVAAVAALNKKLEASQGLIESLKNFSLPRGVTSTNSGSYSTLPQRGQSIIYDSIGREVKRDALGNAITPAVEQAPGIPTLAKQRELELAQQGLSQQEQRQSQAAQALAKARQGMAATESIPPQTFDSMQSKLQGIIAARPNSVEASELSGLLARLHTDSGPLTDPMQINRVLTQFTTRLKSPDLQTQGMDAGVSKFLGGVVDSIRTDLGQGFTPIKNANTAYRNFTDSTVNPLRQGPVGLLAQNHGSDPATAAMVSKFDGLMNRGTDPTAKVSDIATAGKELAKVDPTAFEGAFKSWLSRKIQSATTASGGGSALPTAEPSTLASKVFNDPLQWQGIKDATKTMADVRGLPATDMIRGLENLRQLTTAMESRPRNIGGMSPADLKQMGSASNVANLVRVASFLPVNRVGEAIERHTFGKTLSQLDTILTSPEGAKMLIELGKVPVMSRKAQVILGTWGSTMGNSPGLSDSNPPE